MACRETRGVAPLGAVLAGDGQVHAGKEGVDLDDGTAAHEGDRPAGALIQLLQEVAQVLRDAYRGRRFGEVDERAIDSKKVGAVAAWVRGVVAHLPTVAFSRL